MCCILKIQNEMFYLHINFAFASLSAWVSSQNICDFVQNKATFCTKNHTKTFQNALKEIDEELTNKIKRKITLKDIEVEETNDIYLFSVFARRLIPSIN